MSRAVHFLVALGLVGVSWWVPRECRADDEQARQRTLSIIGSILGAQAQPQPQPQPQPSPQGGRNIQSFGPGTQAGAGWNQTGNQGLSTAREPIMAPRSQAGNAWNTPAGGLFGGSGLLQPGANLGANPPQAQPKFYMQPGAGWNQPGASSGPWEGLNQQPANAWAQPGAGWNPTNTNTNPWDYGTGDSGYGYPSSSGGYTYPPGSYSTSYGNTYGGGISQPSPPSNPPPPPQRAVAPVVVEPLANAINLRGRPITAVELSNAKSVFSSRFQEMAKGISQQLDGALINQQQLLAELSKNAVGADDQIRILEAIQRGDAAQAQTLWATYAKDIGRAAEISGQVAATKAIGEVQAKAAAGTLARQDVDVMRDILNAGELPADRRQAAEGILREMTEHVAIQEALARAVPGQAADIVNLPAGTVTVIWNPKLPARSAVLVNNSCVMVGTGGQGTLRMTTDSVARAVGLPVSSGAPVDAYDHTGYADGILIINAASNGIAWQYALVESRREAQIEPGTMHYLQPSTVTIVYDRGAGQGDQRYTLSAGTYQFQRSGETWNLYRQNYQAVIDNSGNPQPFHYVIQNQRASVEPYGTKTHRMDYPIVIKFDRGGGAAKQCCISGKITVAVNAADNRWDLFRADAAASTPSGFVPAF